MKVLLAEDDRVTRRLLEKKLTGWGYEVEPVADGLAAWERLQEPDAPRLILLDWMMPGMDGIDVCRKLRERESGDYCYVIMLTGKAETEDIVEGLEAGADDYLTKPVVPEELKVRIRAGTRILDLQNELLEAHEALRYQATHDALTGLWNRAAVMELLHREVARTRREENPLAAIICDIDHFKTINDTHGHTVGDDVLRIVSERLQANTRRYDSVGRYGGEEFLVLLPGCGVVEAGLQAERMRSALADQPCTTDAGELTVTMSFGITIYSGSEEIAPADLIDQADKALYEAKNQGRDRIVIA